MKKFLFLMLSLTMLILCAFPAAATDSVVTYSSGSAASNVVGLKPDTSYYIMDIAYEKYINIYSSSTSTTTGVVGRDRNTNIDLAKWTLFFTSDGKVQFIDPEGRALSVNTSNGLYAGPNTGASTQKFNIVRRTNADSSQGLYYIRYGNYYIKSSATGTLSLNNSITSGTFWSICKSEKGTSALYNYNTIEPSTIDTSNRYSTAMSALGYTYTEFTNSYASAIYAKMQTNTDLMCVATHNADLNGVHAAGITIETETSIEYIFAHSDIGQVTSRTYYGINNLSSNAMAAFRCVFLPGCSTGVSFTYNGVEYNLLTALFDKGCHCAVGTTRLVTGEEVYRFYDYMNFFSNTDYSIQELMSAIDEYYYVATNIHYPYVIYGDRYQYLNFES